MAQTQHATKTLTHAQYITERLGRMREVRGFTVVELARRADMDKSHLGKVLRDERGLRADELVCLCYALGVTLEQLIPIDLRHRLDDLCMRTPDGRPMF